MSDAVTSQDSGVTAPQPRLPSEIWVLVAASFVIAVGFGIVAPALPLFASSFGVGAVAIFAVTSGFALTRLCFAPVSGKLVNVLGERPIYLSGILIVALSTGAVAFAQSYWQLLVFRGLGGIGSTLFSVSAFALLVRLAPAQLRGRASGLFMTAFLVGSIAGPVLGGGLLVISLRLPFIVYAIALVIAALVGWLFLRNSVLAAPERGGDVAPVSVRYALRQRAYQAALAANFTKGWLAQGLRLSVIPLFVVRVLDQAPGWAGVALSVFSAGTVAMLLVSGRLADAIGRKPLVLAGLLVCAGGTIWVGFTGTLGMFLIAALVSGIGVGLFQPPLGAVVADVTGSHARGGWVMAGFQMAGDLGVVVGPLLAGVLVETGSFLLAFGATGAVAMVALLVWLRAPETLHERAGPERGAASGAR